MELHDAAYIENPNAGATDVLGVASAEAPLPDSVKILRRDVDGLIADREQHFIAQIAHPNGQVAAIRGVLPGVAEHVPECLQDLGPVCLDDKRVGQIHDDLEDSELVASW